MRLSVLQYAATTDAAANLDTIQRLVESAAEPGTELIVLPEAAMHDFGPPDLELGPIAQTLDGEFVTSLSELARRTGTAIVAGMFERSDDESRPYNTLVVVNSTGELVSTYRKVHLYDSFGYRESERLLGGAPEPAVVELGGMRFGLMTCYDLRFPEFARALVDAGSDVLIVPAAWVRGPLKEDHWRTLLRARAIENTVYVAGAAQTGDHYTACSMIVDPMGVTLAALGDETGVASAEVEVDHIAAARKRNPSLANRRLATSSGPASAQTARV
ncbi:MAG: carbon-nitrogen hydrolase family protein [Nocardioidaceae bacterium]